MCHYLPNWKPTNFKLDTQMKYDDACLTTAMSSKFKGQGRKDYVVRLTGVGLALKSRTKSPQNIKIVKKVAHLTDNNAHRVRGQKVKG